MTGEVVYEGRDLEVLADLPRYYNWIVDLFAPHIAGRGLEIGAGTGTISGRIRPYLDTLQLVEPSANLIPALESRFSDDESVSVAHATLEAYLAQTGGETYDTIAMVNVLEHIEDDAAALAGLFDALRPGGHLLIFVPALPFLYSALDRSVGHFRRYTRSTLRSPIEQAGFSIRILRYFDILGVGPWWLINTLGGATGFNPRLAGLYDAVGVPVTRAVETLVPPPLGKNLIAVAEKPHP